MTEPGDRTAASRARRSSGAASVVADPGATTTPSGATGATGAVAAGPSTTGSTRSAVTAAPAATITSVRPTGRRRQVEGRKVRRLIRNIDPWSVLKCSLVFFVCVWVMFMVTGVVVWQLASSTGTIDKLVSFIQQFGYKDVQLTGSFLLRQYALLGLVLTFAATLASVVAAVVFNLISDLIGGVWFTVIEEETSRPVSGSPPADRIM